MKKGALALSILTIGSYAFAELPLPTQVSIPQLPGGFFIGGSALYLKSTASNGDFDYAVIQAFPQAQIKTFNPDYDWGWGINAGYIFPQTGNDLAINYWQVGGKDIANMFRPDNGNLNSTFFPIIITEPVGILGFGTTINQIVSKIDLDLDQVDLSFGQYLNLGNHLQLHPTIGIEYTYIDQTINTSLLGGVGGDPNPLFPILIPFAGTSKLTSDFNGIGPNLGIDGIYNIGSGVGVVGDFKAGVLAGNVDAKLTTITTEFGGMVDLPILPGTFLNSFTSSYHRVVPTLQAKLGADYSFQFNNNANSFLSLEVGYQAAEYFNALDYLKSSSTLVFTANPLVNFFFVEQTGTVVRRTTNFGVHGPYANLTFHF